MTDQPFGGPTDQNALGRSLFLRQYRPVGGPGMAAAILIGIAAVLSAVDAWSDWHRYQVVNDYVTGARPVSLEDLDDADRFAMIAVWSAIIALIAAGVVFLVWLWRARQNAENLCMAPHRRARGWVVGSWICPVVNFWFPFMIVDDVYRASRPDNPRDLVDLRTVPGSPLLGWWWGLWVTMWVVNRLGSFSLRGELTVDSFRSYAIFSTIGTLALIPAAVLIIRIMREISAWQAPNRIN